MIFRLLLLLSIALPFGGVAEAAPTAEGCRKLAQKIISWSLHKDKNGWSRVEKEMVKEGQNIRVSVYQKDDLDPEFLELLEYFNGPLKNKTGTLTWEWSTSDELWPYSNGEFYDLKLDQARLESNRVIIPVSVHKHSEVSDQRPDYWIKMQWVFGELQGRLVLQDVRYDDLVDHKPKSAKAYLQELKVNYQKSLR